MNTLKLTFSLLLMASLVIFSTGCHKDEENKTLGIEIVSPADGSKISNASNVEFHVKFTADEGLHEYNVKVTEKGKAEKILDSKGHKHEKSAEIKENRDLSSFPDGTVFELTATSCFDHDCKKVETKIVSFTK